MDASTGSVVALAMLLAGAVLFVVLAYVAVRAAARVALDAPTTKARLAELEAKYPVILQRVEDAEAVARKARTIASNRRRRAKAEANDDDDAPKRAARNGAEYLPGFRLGDGPYPVGFADEDATDGGNRS